MGIYIFYLQWGMVQFSDLLKFLGYDVRGGFREDQVLGFKFFRRSFRFVGVFERLEFWFSWVLGERGVFFKKGYG